MLISVHIPKTGGGSFRKLLEQYFGDRLLPDYQDRPFLSDTTTRNQAALNSRRDVKDLPVKYDCIHGHFLPTKYDIPEQQNIFITWMRCPYEWSMSRYYFGQRTNDPLITKNMSIYDFCELEKFHNFYEKYLWNFDLEQFSFIGITEDLENSMNIFTKQYGLENIKVGSRNVNPNKSVGEKYQIDDDLKDLIFKNNKNDFEIYHKAVEFNKMLKKKHLN